jgi:hypothetical protein
MKWQKWRACYIDKGLRAQLFTLTDVQISTVSDTMGYRVAWAEAQAETWEKCFTYSEGEPELWLYMELYETVTWEVANIPLAEVWGGWETDKKAQK